MDFYPFLPPLIAPEFRGVGYLLTGYQMPSNRLCEKFSSHRDSNILKPCCNLRIEEFVPVYSTELQSGCEVFSVKGLFLG